VVDVPLPTTARANRTDGDAEAGAAEAENCKKAAGHPAGALRAADGASTRCRRMTHTSERKPTLCTQDALYDTREYTQWTLDLRKKSDALRSSALSGYLMRRLRHAVSRPCDAICTVLEPSAVLRLVRCGRC
jgi:hypothetical protein